MGKLHIQRVMLLIASAKLPVGLMGLDFCGLKACNWEKEWEWVCEKDCD